MSVEKKEKSAIINQSVEKKYTNKIIKQIKQKIVKWLKNNDLKTIQDIKEKYALKEEQKTFYQTFSWLKIATITDGVNVGTCKNYQMGYLLENAIPEAEYMKQKGEIKLELFDYIKRNKLFDEKK